ncbi:MAG: hypothetical protein LLG97_09975 [Deltaproteobacteria bacterium]|nr:hypothetical protein [Deltaproteobacteria bacterium]
MKKAAGTVLILVLAVILATPLSGEARGGHHGGGHGGWWVPFAILGGAAVLSSIFYASQADASRATVPEPAPAYVPPAPPAAPSAAGKIFVYPRLGQSEELQAKDRYECHTWAVVQTQYDPVQPTGGVSEARLSQLRANYRRAEDACLDGRGYTVK